MKNLVLISMIALGVACCASTSTPLSVSEEVRRSSQTDDNQFRAITGAKGVLGGLNMLDSSEFPNAQNREIVKIEVLPLSDNNQEARFERWHIQHDQGEVGCFLVKIPLDGPTPYYYRVTRDRKCISTGF